MSAELLIANFLRIAAEDLEGARLLAAAHNRNAIYLCEQAAEKVIRAVVTSENKHAGIKHDLAEMVDLIDDETRASRHCERSSISPSMRPPTGTPSHRAGPSGSFQDRARRSCFENNSAPLQLQKNRPVTREEILR
jgi:HEPN domain